jgi:hypothetical protein
MEQSLIINPETNLLLEWGKTALQKKKIPEYLAEIERDLDNIGLLVKDNLEMDLMAVVKQAKSARGVVGDISIVTGLAQEDWEWSDVLYSFDAFDMVVFLMAGIDGVLRNRDAVFAGRLFNMLQIELEEIFGLLFSETFSALRFVAFNQRRKNRLRLIEASSRYLFPWYELACDLSPAVVDELAGSYHLFAAEKLPEHIPDYIREDIDYYIFEVTRDKALNDYIRTENKLLLMLDRTVQEHWALRLWNSAQKAAVNRLLPETVESVGLSKVSASVLKTGGASFVDEMLMDFVKACYAPDLNEAERIEILLACETRLNTVVDTGVASSVSVRRCIENLIKLSQGEANANDVSEDLLDFWIDQAVRVAKEISPASLSEKFKGKINDILHEGKILFESLPHPFQLAGLTVTAAATLKQSKTFELGAGEYIKITCDWHPETKKSPSYIHIEWKANLTSPGKLWARFVNPVTGKKLNDSCLGSKLEGRRDLESRELGFDPTKIVWAISIIFESDE